MTTAPAVSRAARPQRRTRVSGVLWPALAVGATVVFALARLLVSARFYFADDTERGSFGQWWQLGEDLLNGTIPVLDPSAWQAGNYFAEGQWGILNPVTWLIALATRASDDPVLLATTVKVVFLALMALGVYLLAREFGAHRPWAALAGALVPLGGFTVYMDAASWSTGMFNTAVLPWVWWGLRRAVERGRSPIPYLVSSYVLIAFGYVFGVIVLVVILVETLVRHLVRRDRTRIVRTLAASAWGALLTVVVYLPGILTSPVTTRGQDEVGNFFFLNADLTDMASAASPWMSASIRAWWGDYTAAPLVYIAWLLPLFPLVLPMARSSVKRCLPLLILGALMLIAVLGPSHLGPLRWPLRLIPYLVIAVVVLFAVAASRAYPHRITRTGIVVSLALIGISGVLSMSNVTYAVAVVVAIAVIQVVALVAMVWIGRRRRWPAARRTLLAVLGAFAVTAVVVAGQLRYFPHTPLPSVDAPGDVETMTEVLAEPHGDAIVAGNPEAEARQPDSWHERLMANLWYLSPTSVASTYTVLPYASFSADLCADLRGVTCRDALETLWGTDPDTGERVADLMSLSTIIAMKHTYPREPEVPAGWSLAEEGEFTWLLERDEVLPPAGGVTWTGEGTSVTETSGSDTDVTFTVDSVGADPRVVLSRLDYPGYRIAGAGFADPVRDWLLTVDLSGVEPGQSVTVSFRPPGFPLLVASFAGAFVLAAGWLVVRLVVRRRGARAGSA